MLLRAIRVANDPVLLRDFDSGRAEAARPQAPGSVGSEKSARDHSNHLFSAEADQWKLGLGRQAMGNESQFPH